MNRNQSHSLPIDELASRLEYLAKAGALLTIDRSHIGEEWQGAAPGIQSLFETIEGLAADLYHRLELMRRDEKNTTGIMEFRSSKDAA